VNTAPAGRPAQDEPAPMPARSCPASGRLDTLIVRPGRPSVRTSRTPVNRRGRAPWPADLGRPDASRIHLRCHLGNGRERVAAQVAFRQGTGWALLLDSTEMAVALHRSGVPLRGAMTAQEVAAAILAGVDRHGADTIRAAADEIAAQTRFTESGGIDWVGHKDRAALLGGYRREGLCLALVHRVMDAAQH
jgi:hypothetical protein